jgi:3-hydroxybutyryl-CoA dehydrogenase
MARSIFPDTAGERAPEPPTCPWCDGRDTELLSPFGGQLSVAQCWCYRCRTGFEYLKWEEARQTETAESSGPAGSGTNGASTT